MRRFLAAAASAAAALLVLAAPSPGSHSSGAKEHWKKAGSEIHVDLGDCMDNPRWDRAVRAAAPDWSRSMRVTLHIVGCDAAYREVRVFDAPYGRTGWAGRTEWSYGYHFLTRQENCPGAGDCEMGVKLNSTYGNGYSDNGRRSTACHELGHALGLAHRSSGCLVTPINPRMVGPDRHDFDQLRAIYGHEELGGL